MQPRKFYAVLHAEDGGHGIKLARTALLGGAHGIALINQFCTPEDLERIAIFSRQAFPQADILINILHDDAEAVRLAWRVRAQIPWAQSCGIWCDAFDPLSPELHQALSAGMPVFGGIGFKYQQQEDLFVGWNLAQAVAMRSRGLVAMTSGPRTGCPPSPAKLGRYRQLIGPDCPLAVASGVNSENIGPMLPLVSHFLVGTSLEQQIGDRSEIVGSRVVEIAQIVQKFNEESSAGAS